ncbi:MAG TPA: TlpA disulfide reductase family protein [Chitinophagaceae bacterium]|nr:TlpA disulfide reductase family protein [Chitinophagaceae bacterium]
MRILLLNLCILTGLQGRSVYAQELQVGDILQVDHLSPGKKIKVLEFWSINCISCIRGFPKLEALHDQFRDELDIVLVNRESSQKVQEFFAKRTNLSPPSLPVISGDSVLYKKFGDLPLPFQVWLDSAGVIQAITEVSALNESNISEMLKRKKISARTVRKRKVSTSLVDAGSKEWGTKVNYYSYIAGCSEQISVDRHLGTTISDDRIRISEDCSRILDLYKIAYGEDGKFKFPYWFSTKVNVVNQGLFEEKRYSYDLVVPFGVSAGKFIMMQQDLERSFGLKAFVSKGYYSMVELLAQPGPNLLTTKGGSPGYLVQEKNNQLHMQLRNQPFDSLVHILRKYLPKLPMLLQDRSSYKMLGKIDIGLCIELNEQSFLKSLQTELARYNLTIFVNDIPMDVLTVTDK